MHAADKVTETKRGCLPSQAVAGPGTQSVVVEVLENVLLRNEADAQYYNDATRKALLVDQAAKTQHAA